MSIKRRSDEPCILQCKKGKIEQSEKEYFINFESEPPSLESISLITTAINLWTQSDIKESVKQHSKSYGSDIISTDGQDAYLALEGRVLKKVSELFLPDLLELKVSNVIRPVGMQLLKWFDWNDQEYCNLFELFQWGCSLYWTVEGIIDKRKCVEELIKSEDDFYYLYELACKYCLEKSVESLWEKIPLTKRSLPYIYSKYNNHIIAYWAAYMESDLPNLLNKIKEKDFNNIYDSDYSINKNMITLSILVCNVFALRYFWPKLTFKEKEVNLENWLNLIIEKYDRVMPRRYYEYQKYHVYTDILCFLLSKLKSQKEIFQKHSLIILRALFYDWPFQRFFFPTISMMMEYLQEEVFVKIMSCMVGEIKEGRTTHELFRKVWYRSSLKLRNACLPFLLNKTFILLNLLSVDDVETVCLILNSFSQEEKKKAIFDLTGREKLFSLLKKNKLSLLDSLTAKTLPTTCDIKHFRISAVEKCGQRLCHDLILEDKFSTVDILLQWSFETPDEIERFKTNGIDKVPIFISLVFLGNFKVINQFMNWCFKIIEERNDFTNSFMSNFSAWEELLRRLSCKEDGWDLFEKFLSYYSCSSETLSDLKNECLKMVASFVECHRFDFATHLLNWSLNSVKEVNEFKNELLLSDRGTRMIWYDITRKYQNWNNVKNTLKWFSPLSKKYVTSVKQDLEDDDFSDTNCEYSAKNQKLFFCHLLDNFAESCPTSDQDGYSSYDEKEFMEILNEAVEEDEENLRNDEVENTEDNKEANAEDDYENEYQSDSSMSSYNSDQLIKMAGSLSDIDIICTDTDDDISETEYYDEEVVLLLVEMLNTVEMA